LPAELRLQNVPAAAGISPELTAASWAVESKLSMIPTLRP